MVHRIMNGVLLASCLISSPGCTLLGAGAGAGVDALMRGPYEPRSPKRLELERGDHVRLVTRAGRRVEGRYAGTIGPSAHDPEIYLVIDAEQELAPVASSDVRSLGVEVTGKGWLYGGVLGLAVDVALVVGVSIAVSNMEYGNADLWEGDSGCLC
jgi:hypothetical protein